MIRFLSAISIFFAAFLLFQIQPIMARFVLPWYGGSAAVWGACILFFQTLLFLGYLYAHWLSTRLFARQQAVVHVALLAVSLLLLPVIPGPEWKPAGDDDPMLGILALLTSCIGLPYFLLSSTSPLTQSWLVRTSPKSLPYRFYALSNLASLGALLAYPVIVERLWSLSTQGAIWSTGYGCFVVLFSLLAWRSAVSPALSSAIPLELDGPERGVPGARTGWSMQMAWVLLAALPSALSLAVTNHLTQNVAAIPLLWIVPLAIYLFTLILCFEGDGWYRRSVFVPANMLAFGVAGYLLLHPELNTNIALQLPAFSIVLFTVCMSLHGELVQRRPGGDRLTHFYLLMALGGAVGGVSVGFGAPYLLSGYFEMPLALSVCAVGILLLEFRRSIVIDVLLGGLVVWVCSSSAAFILSTQADAVVTGRNFYGGLRVEEQAATGLVAAHRDLVHGAIIHGTQFLDEEKRRDPTAYYARGSGADLAVRHFRRPQGRVGVVGLGAGAMAAYGAAGEEWRFYELNPMVVEFARSHFTFLADSPANIETILGDGRLSLEHEPERRFDVLAIDAFSGDSIPVHLLSLEAFELYFGQLEAEGVLAVHISNAVLDLRPVVVAAAHTLGKSAVEVTVKPDETGVRSASTWLLVASPEAFASRPSLTAMTVPTRVDPAFRVWTDDYSNLLSVMR